MEGPLANRDSGVLSNHILLHSFIRSSPSHLQTPKGGITRRRARKRPRPRPREGTAFMASATPAILLRTPSFSSHRTSFHGTPLTPPAKSIISVKNSVSCRAQKQGDQEPVAPVTRRLALTLLVGAAAITNKVSPADAAYGEAANIFGAEKKNDDFKRYSGNGFNILLPSKWNPSKEVEFPGQVLRYEDNFDPNTNVSIVVTPTDKKSIQDFGSPEQFLSQVDFLLGKQAFSGKAFEGGFDPDVVATASLLDAATPVINGKQYYTLNVLTRTADGDEGGKHQLIIATIKDGKLYICKAQAGDKRWNKGTKRFVENTANSFNVV